MPKGPQTSPGELLLGRTVVVLVQGPLEQSPRMAAQAAMLAAAGAHVRALGFGEDADGAWQHPSIELLSLPGAGRDLAPSRAGRLPRTAWRLLSTAVGLRRALAAALAGADLVLAQVPPALPGVWLAQRLARRRGVPLVLDWHNLSAPMAGLKFGAGHPALRLLETLERRLAAGAALQFAVTPALAEHLRCRYGSAAVALPDRPLPAVPDTAAAPLGPEAAAARLGAAPLCGERRWRVAVSATSWTLDEDTDLLLEAARRLPIPQGRGLLLIVTGKGPRRADFERRAGQIRRPGLRLATGWLPEPEYRALLRGAALGLSLHRSASGLDFPMKLVDMEAAGLPVAALDYGPALRDGLAGRPGARSFTDAEGLAKLLHEALLHEALLHEALVDEQPAPAAFCGEGWEALWRRLALPRLLEVLR